MCSYEDAAGTTRYLSDESWNWDSGPVFGGQTFKGRLELRAPDATGTHAEIIPPTKVER
jgi:hypothetical protein